MSKIKLNSKAIEALLKESSKDVYKIAQEALKKTANDVEKKITEFIQTYFYDTYNPRLYERTYNLLNSVTQTKMVKKGNLYQITIFLNPSSDYYNSNNERFYINDYGRYTVPKNYSQHYDSINVFDLASQGIHGLPSDGISGWHNNNFIKTSPNFIDMINEEMFYSDLLTRYSNMLKSSGFYVQITK